MSTDERVETPAPTPPTATKARHWKKILAVLIIAPVVLLGAVFSMAQFERGTFMLCRIINTLSAGMVKVDWSSGTLAHGGAANSVNIHLSSTHVDINNVSGKWAWDYVPLRWRVLNLAADEVNVTIIPTPSTGKPVGNILMPFIIEAERVQVATVNIITSTNTTTLYNIDGAVSSDKRNHQINLSSLTQGTADYRGEVKIDGVRPFAIDGQVQAISTVDNHEYQLDLSAKGDFKRLNLAVNASGGVPEQPLSGKGDLQIQLLDQYYIHKGQVNLAHLNPYVFWNKLLKADLDVTLNATPQAVDATDNERQPVNGDWLVVNHAPAPLSDFALPVQQVSGRFALTSQKQDLNDIKIIVSNNGLIQGNGVWQDGKGGFKFDIKGFDLKNVHPKLLGTQLGGVLDINATKGEQHFVASLKNAGSNRLELFADVLVDHERVTITQAKIAGVGDAAIEAQGELAYTEGLPFKGKAQLLQFNLADLGDFPSSRLVGQFDVDGLSLPAAQVNIKGDLNDSNWAGVPAKGVVDVSFAAPDKITARNLDVTIGANHIDAKGALGLSSVTQDKLNININAPNLAQLQFGFAGSLVGTAELTGSLTKPRGKVDLTANALKLGEQTVQSAKINGVWETGERGALNGTVDIERYLNGLIKLDTVKPLSDAPKLKLSIPIFSDNRRPWSLPSKIAAAPAIALPSVVDNVLDDRPNRSHESFSSSGISGVEISRALLSANVPVNSTPTSTVPTVRVAYILSAGSSTGP
jgi:translocation and assembly module TamB